MDESTSRRSFLKNTAATAAVASGAGTCMCGLSSCAGNTPKADKASVQKKGGKVHLDLTKVPELQQVGASVRLAGGDVPNPIIVMRTKDNEYIALSAKCTHFGRAVEYNHDTGLLRCVSLSHSEFSLDGKVHKSPAKKPLKIYETVLKDDALIISV